MNLYLRIDYCFFLSDSSDGSGIYIKKANFYQNNQKFQFLNEGQFIYLWKSNLRQRDFFFRIRLLIYLILTKIQKQLNQRWHYFQESKSEFYYFDLEGEVKIKCIQGIQIIRGSFVILCEQNLFQIINDQILFSFLNSIFAQEDRGIQYRNSLKQNQQHQTIKFSIELNYLNTLVQPPYFINNKQINKFQKLLQFPRQRNKVKLSNNQLTLLMLPQAKILILVCFLIQTVKCVYLQVLQPGCPASPNDEYIAKNAYKYFYDRLGRGIDITQASIVDWNMIFQPNDDSHQAFRNQVFKFKYIKSQADDGSGCAAGTPYPYLGSVKCYNNFEKYLNFKILTQSDLINVLHYIYSSHEGFESKSWMNNVSVRELLNRFHTEGKFWVISIGEYRTVKYSMDFSNVDCDHYLTQPFINQVYQMEDQNHKAQFLADYGTSAISDIILGGMIISIRSYAYDGLVPSDVLNKDDLKLAGNPIILGGNRAALEQTLINQGDLFATFFSTLADFPALIRIKTVSFVYAINIIDLYKVAIIQNIIITYVDSIQHEIGIQIADGNKSFFNSFVSPTNSQLVAGTATQKFAVAFSDGQIETSNEFQLFQSAADTYITDFNIYFLNEPQISKKYANNNYDWDYQDNEVSPPYMMVDNYLISFQLFGKQEKEQVCIVVNGQVMKLSSPIPLNLVQGDFQSLWIYTTPQQDCGTFPPVVNTVINDSDPNNFYYGMYVMFQSGYTSIYAQGALASYKNEIIVDLWILYATEELTLIYENPHDNIHYRSISPKYPNRLTLENHRKIKRIDRLLLTDRSIGQKMNFSFNGHSLVYCNQQGCDFPIGEDLKSISFQTQSNLEIDRRPYW